MKKKELADPKKKYFVGQTYTRRSIAESLDLDFDDPRLTDQFCNEFCDAAWNYLFDGPCGDDYEETMYDLKRSLGLLD